MTYTQNCTLSTDFMKEIMEVGQDFAINWYRTWKDGTGQRRLPDEARSRYEAWQTKSG